MCWKCGQNIFLRSDEYIGRDEECPICKTDLHSCKNCKFYAPNEHFECHETIDERVSDKEKRNFCSYFKVQPFYSDGSGQKKIEEAKAAFASLFSN